MQISPEFTFELYNKFPNKIRKSFLGLLVKNLQKKELHCFHKNIAVLSRYSSFLVFSDKIYNYINFFSLKTGIIYENILSIFLYHHKVISSIVINLQVPILKICIGDRDIPIYLQLLKGETDYYKEGKNGIVIKISSDEDEIFYMIFFLGKNEVFISTIQYLFSKNKKYILLEKYHRIAFYIVLKIAQKLKKNTLLSYSNQNHPYSGEGKFLLSAHYNQYCEGIGMVINQDLFYQAQFENIKIPEVNEFLSYNIDKNIIAPFLKQI